MSFCWWRLHRYNDHSDLPPANIQYPRHVIQCHLALAKMTSTNLDPVERRTKKIGGLNLRDMPEKMGISWSFPVSCLQKKSGRFLFPKIPMPSDDFGRYCTKSASWPPTFLALVTRCNKWNLKFSIWNLFSKKNVATLRISLDRPLACALPNPKIWTKRTLDASFLSTFLGSKSSGSHRFGCWKRWVNHSRFWSYDT